MALGTTQYPGTQRTGFYPSEDRPRRGLRSPWLRPHLGFAIVGAVAGYAFGYWLGDNIAGGYPVAANSGTNNVAIVLALVFGVVGWLTGIGAFTYPVQKLIGKEPAPPLPETGWIRYIRMTEDHKVVGLQYTVGVLLFFFVGGLFAMAIRTELLSPTNHVFGPGVYIEIVSEHGTMMMMMATSVIVGSLGNWLVPLMIGARRMAFPRLEAFSFWIFEAGFLVILTAPFFGGFPTGWTGYAPLQTQAGGGMDAYLVGFAVIGIGMISAGFNIGVTIIHYRAPGMTWSRLPIFVWGLLATCALLTLATPTLIMAGLFGILDRTAQTAFYVTEHGGSSFLWQNLFWFFGHPEVYIMALPGFGIVMELLPVFTRKPLFGYRTAAAGMIGVALLSFFVWQHHLFQSGINPDMRPLFMLTTELISIPTGFLFLVTLGTLWKSKIRFEAPMLFCLAMLFNFLIGGITGVFLSDVPVNVTVHGSFFVMAHFHYTIMGGLIFAFFAGLYYWLPKMTGVVLSRRLSIAHFWTMFIFFNLTFFPLFFVGILGQPRRVFEYAHNLQTWNDVSSIGAYCLGASFFLFIINFVWSVFVDPKPAKANPWGSLGLEWQTPTPVPWYNFSRIPIVLADPYHYGEPDAPDVADLGSPARQPVTAGVARTSRAVLDRSATTTQPEEPMADDVRTSAPALGFDETPDEVAFELRAHEGALWTGGRLLIGIWAFAFAALAFAYFYLRSGNNGQQWRPAGITAPTGFGAAIFAFTVATALIVMLSYRRFKQERFVEWVVAGWTGVLGGLVIVGLQIWQLTELRFFPGSSGYASCFIGWASVNIAVLLAATYWLETSLARELRLRRAAAGEGRSASDTLPATRQLLVSVQGCATFWGFVAFVATFFWVLFYVL